MPADAAPDTLSGGESQRLALAGALVMEPDVLLLDEPTAMLDADTAATVRRVVDEVVTRRGLTLVVVEHRLEGWVDLVDRLVVLDAGGEVVADGPPRSVLTAHAESLMAQGIWVPGVADPTPDRIDLPPAGGTAPAASGAVGPGRVVVSARDVTVEHRNRQLGGESRTTTAVTGSDLDVHAGELLALVGPSGAGKSSLLTALGGLVERGRRRGRRGRDGRPVRRPRRADRAVVVHRPGPRRRLGPAARRDRHRRAHRARRGAHHAARPGPGRGGRGTPRGRPARPARPRAPREHRPPAPLGRRAASAGPGLRPGTRPGPAPRRRADGGPGPAHVVGRDGLRGGGPGGGDPRAKGRPSSSRRTTPG